MKKQLVIIDDYSDDMFAYCDANGMRYLSPKANNKKDSPTDMYELRSSFNSSYLARVDFEFEIVDDFDYYLVDRNWFHVDTKQETGDMYWHFQCMESIPIEDYENEDDFFDTFKDNCDISEDEEDDMVAIYTFYKRHGRGGILVPFRTLAMCTAEEGEKFGVPAEMFMD